jgi:hypothetical protein
MMAAHNHFTREIRPAGACPGCDAYATESASSENPGALTGAERDAVRLAGELYTLIAEQVCGNGPTRGDDLAELRAAVHDIQHAVMAQAAARLYPGEFRLLGEVIGRRPGTEGEPK